MPGIECLAPDRTETKSGLLASPKLFPTTFSRFAREIRIWSCSRDGTVPVVKYSRQASVVIVNPGGTGNPI